MQPLHLRPEVIARSKRLLSRLEACDLCPRRCLANRTRNELGDCRIGANLKVSSYNLHFGEEPPISGHRGSGTIFLAGCNLQCLYCQNYDISQFNQGVEVTERQFVDMMIDLQESNAHNINFVTPTHFAAQILSALLHARNAGLALPIVYNSSGYDSVETLKEFEGLVDIYMPDMRYSSSEEAQRYSGAGDYPEVNRAAVKEMHRQVGDLRLDRDGVAVRGLLVRHLILPDGIAGSGETLRFIAEEISTDTYVSVMSQYRPVYKASDDNRLNRRVSRVEYFEAGSLARELGLTNCYYQEVPG
jgi:putative pyruvate formate lyase activating enzyme